MKYICIIISVFIIPLLCSCKHTPDDAYNMGLMKVANDTLEIVFADSYLRIKGIETSMKNDTLYIRVTSIGHIHSSEKILVPLKSNIKGVCLQNDKYWNIDSIPWSPTLNK